jgi:hypothetical protein
VAKAAGGIPKTPCQTTAQVLLEAHGWVDTVGGKHVVKMVKAGERPITLPYNKRREYPPSLRHAILKQAGLKGPTQDAEGGTDG